VLKGIDHIVILVRDLAAAIEDYRRLGFTVTPGGEHVGLGTHNALITFEDGAYFELIAFKEPDRPHDQRWWPRLAAGEGPVDYCVFGDDLEGEAAAMRARGVAGLHGPFAMGRQRPDGVRIDWRLVSLTAPIGQSVVPFMIEDTTPRELRVPGGAAARHPLGVTGVAGLVLVADNLERAAGELAQAIGIEGQPAAPSVEGAAGARHFTLGRHRLEVVQPAPGANPLAEHLARFGANPYEIQLHGPEPKLLPTDTAHGARIRVVV